MDTSALICSVVNVGDVIGLDRTLLIPPCGNSWTFPGFYNNFNGNVYLSKHFQLSSQTRENSWSPSSSSGGNEGSVGRLLPTLRVFQSPTEGAACLDQWVMSIVHNRCQLSQHPLPQSPAAAQDIAGPVSFCPGRCCLQQRFTVDRPLWPIGRQTVLITWRCVQDFSECKETTRLTDNYHICWFSYIKITLQNNSSHSFKKRIRNPNHCSSY